MTAPKLSRSTPNGRYYVRPGAGLRVSAIGDAISGPNMLPSVTTILNVQHDENIEAWKRRQVAERAFEIDPTDFDDHRDAVAEAVRQPDHPAAAIGDEVHNAIDYLVAHGHSGAPLTTPTANAMFNQYLGFIGYNQDFRPLVTELTVYNETYGYAGTLDMLADISGETWLIDIKTGSRIYPKVAMQCAALAHAEWYADADGNQHAMPQIDRLGVLHVRPRSARLYELPQPEIAFNTFCGLLRGFLWKTDDAAHAVAAQPHLST